MTAFVLGAGIEQADAEKLRLQGNTAWGGCGSPLAMAACTIDTSEYAEVELPVFPGLRRVTVASFTSTAQVYQVFIQFTLTDDTGVLGTVLYEIPVGPGYDIRSDDIEWSRPVDGKIVLKVESTASSVDVLNTSFCIAPKPPTVAVSGMEGDGYMHTDRTAEGADLNQRMFGIWYSQAWNGWRRPQVHDVIVDPSGANLRFAVGTNPLRATLPIYSRGHKIGMSAQGANTGSGTPELRLKIGGETLITLDTFPGAQGTIISDASAAALPAGYGYCDLEVYIPTSGGLDLYSVAVYEEVE